VIAASGMLLFWLSGTQINRLFAPFPARLTITFPDTAQKSTIRDAVYVRLPLQKFLILLPVSVKLPKVVSEFGPGFTPQSPNDRGQVQNGKGPKASATSYESVDVIVSEFNTEIQIRSVFRDDRAVTPWRSQASGPPDS
jgi:hypothetical protein